VEWGGVSLALPSSLHRITSVQLRSLLTISSRYELDGFLKHGVPLEYTIEDFGKDRKTLDNLRRKRQAENETPTPS